MHFQNFEFVKILTCQKNFEIFSGLQNLGVILCMLLDAIIAWQEKIKAFTITIHLVVCHMFIVFLQI